MGEYAKRRTWLVHLVLSTEAGVGGGEIANVKQTSRWHPGSTWNATRLSWTGCTLRRYYERPAPGQLVGRLTSRSEAPPRDENCSHSTSPEAVDYLRARWADTSHTNKDKNNHNHDEAPSISLHFQPTRLRANELRAQTWNHTAEILQQGLGEIGSKAGRRTGEGARRRGRTLAR
jgi:hypothetical protein